MAIDPTKIKPITLDESGNPTEPTPVQVQPPAPAPAATSQPAETPATYNWPNLARQRVTGSRVIPPEVSAQMGGWTKRTGARGELGPAKPEVDVSFRDPSQRVDVVPTLKRLGVPWQTGDYVPPESWFDTNVPYSVNLGDGRIIQAADPQTYAALVYRLIRDKGAPEDPRIPKPTQNYTPDQIAANLDSGDILTAHRMMLENVRAGNVSEQQYEDFVNGKKTLWDLYEETDGQIGMVNNNPTPTKLQFISAQDYNEFANTRHAELTDSHLTYSEAHNEAVELADYLHQVMASKQTEFYKNFKNDILKYGLKATVKGLDVSEKGYYFPAFPDDFMTWDTIPDEWQLKDSKGVATFPAMLTRTPKILGDKLKKAQLEQETFITKQLPARYTAEISQGSWLNPAYTIRIKTPEGNYIQNDGSQINAELFKQHFTDSEMAGYKTWAAANPETYKAWMRTLSQKNPALAAAIIEKTYPEYTPEKTQAVIGALTAADPALDPLPGQIHKITETPQTPDAQPDIIAESQGIYMYPTPDKSQAIWTALTTFPEAKQVMARYLADVDIPDRVKGIALMLVPNAGTPAAMVSLLAWVDNVWNESYSSAFTQKPYEIWEPETDIGKGAKSLGPLLNPAYLITGDEVVLAKAGIKGLIPRIARMFLRGEERGAIEKVAKVGVEAAGVAAEVAMKDGETLATNEIIKAIAPDEFTAPPTPVEIKPGEPFDVHAQYDVQNGVPVKVETPKYKKAGPGEPIEYVDPITKKAYTRTDNKPPIAPAEPGTPVMNPGEVLGANVGESKGAGGLGQEVRGGPPKDTGLPSGTPGTEGVKPPVQEVKPPSELDVKIDDARSKLKESWDAFKQTGITANPEESARKQAEFYQNLVDLAGLYLQKGYRTAAEFAAELGVKLDDAVHHAWNEASGKSPIRGYENLPPSAKQALENIVVPDQQPLKEGFAGNIRLEKYPEDVRPIIQEWSDAHPGQVAAARRGIIPDVQVQEEGRRLLEEVGSGFSKKTEKWKAGQAWNAEDITALRGALNSKSAEVLDISKAITEGGDNTKDMLRLVQALEEHTALQRTVTGVTAEAGRSLRAFRQEAFDSLTANNVQRMEKLLSIIGDKAKVAKVAKMLSTLDTADPYAVNSFIRAVMNPHLNDYLLELYYNSILSNPKTHIVNAGSNTLNMIAAPIERTYIAGVESVLAPLQGRPRERFFGEAAHDIFGAVRGIQEGARAGWGVITKGASPEAMAKWDMKPRQAFTGKLGAAINQPSRWLEAADQMGKAINRSAALRAEAYRAASIEKLKGQAFLDRLNDLTMNPTEDLLKRANKVAEYRLFRQDPDKFMQFLMTGRDLKTPDITVAGKTFHGLQGGKFVFPFIRTPGNLLKFGLERSPFGILDPRIVNKLASKSPEASEQIGKWLLGLTTATALYLYAKDGLITGEPPQSPGEKDLFYRQGKQPYSIRIGDKWVSYQRAEPFNQTLTQIAALVNGIENKKNGDELAKIAGDTMVTITKNFVSQTYLENIGSIFSAIEDPEHAGTYFIQSLASGFVPMSGALRGAAQLMDTTVRKPTNIVESIEAGLPGLSQNVPAKIDVFGQEVKRQSPALLPINITDVKTTELDQVLKEAGVAPGFVGNSISVGPNMGSIKLTDQEHYDYQIFAGKILKEALDRAIEKGVRDTDALESEVTQARADARKQYLQILQDKGRQPEKD
jgi:hypothetical protein